MMFQLAFWMVASHAVCDFALQSDAMARGKHRRNAVPPTRHEPSWLHWLAAHATIHGTGVALALAAVGRADLWWLGIAEAVTHAGIDHLKTEERITMNVDQALHMLCKAAWIALAVWLPPLAGR